MTDPKPFTSTQIEMAFLRACLLELQALKPGNVHIHAGGHTLSIEQFQKSAAAAAPIMARKGVSVGARILDSVRATREAVGTNTNLGIILLCAPIAQAALDRAQGAIEDRLGRALQGLNVQDAVDAYEAIRLAEPGGMGASDEHDLADRPRITLLEAMRVSARRDRIAYQYANDYCDVLDFGIGQYRTGLKIYEDANWATTHLFMRYLSTIRDTLIARKFGDEISEQVRGEAARVYEEGGGSNLSGLRKKLLVFDQSLKSRELNPGTSADLTVATLFWLELKKDCSMSDI